MAYATQIGAEGVLAMRGELSGQHEAFSYVSLEERIAQDHPLRTIRARAETALKRLSPVF